MKRVLFVSTLLITQYACRNHPDFETEKKAIMVLHNEQRQAHLEENVALLFSDSLTDFIEVNRGIIKRPAREESMKRFQSYFDAVDFIKWDDVSPPVFSFSDDATMATAVVDKLVIVKLKSGDGRLDTTRFAWLAVYKKHNGKWKLHRIGSTNR